MYDNFQNILKIYGKTKIREKNDIQNSTDGLWDVRKIQFKEKYCSTHDEITTHCNINTNSIRVIMTKISEDKNNYGCLFKRIKTSYIHLSDLRCCSNKS